MKRIGTFTLIAVGAILFSGVFWGAWMIAERWLTGRDLPQGTWWQFLLAIPIIGVVALFFEGLGEVIGRAFGINQRGTPKWKEYLGVFTIILVVAAILVAFNWLR
jgi:hypothetical protein